MRSSHQVVGVTSALGRDNSLYKGLRMDQGCSQSHTQICFLPLDGQGGSSVEERRGGLRTAEEVGRAKRGRAW